MADFRGAAWEGFMFKIQSNTNNADITIPELDRAFSRLQRLLEKKVRIFWHKQYFIKYVENQITPWGLRIQIFPNLKKVDDALKLRWEQNLQSCSFEMMNILCNQYEAEIEDLDVQVNAWYIELVLSISNPLFIAREKSLKEHLEEYTTDLINFKEGKYLRDKAAYDNKYAYKWNQPTFNKPTAHPSTRNVPANLTNIPNVTSASSTASSQSTVYREMSHDRFPRKRKNDRKSTSSESLSQTGLNTTKRLPTNSSILDNFRPSSLSRILHPDTPQVTNASLAHPPRAPALTSPLLMTPHTTPTRRNPNSDLNHP
ncbi:uncharacterized protein LOC120910420 [Rana temporaria]|uniref:uncharacterized protein LOC120910420 n=1 Tax=Rana temporaria TaxID=8407 RepID=UPI001AAC5856|nr:uncharacterized protein LOC120910420 [Rana temporaria]